MMTRQDFSLKKTAERVLERENTPLLVLDRSLIRDKYAEFRREFPRARLCFALKSNPAQGVIEVLHEAGCDFEISSLGELEQLLELGIPTGRIISGNPVKDPAFIETACRNGIDVFAFDSPAEVDKLSRLAPGRKVYLRLAVPNEGSEWPLTRKYGVEVNQAVSLLEKAQEEGLDTEGITFHVGSQCTLASTWKLAIEKCRTVWDSAASRGVRLRALNIGGGFPIEYTRAVPSVAEISQAVHEALSEYFPEGVETIAAPGRALVGEAGILAASVVAVAAREEENWLYLDIGVFNGLMEAVGGMKYNMVTDKTGVNRRWVLAGPSCDSFDVIAQETDLPLLETGDKVYILSAGAYTTAYASQFDGFPLPKIYMVG